MVPQSNEMMAQTVNVQLSKVNTQITNMNVDGNAKFKEMDERQMAIEARLATLEDPNRTPTKSIDTSEFRHHEDTSEQEATDLLTATTLTAGMTIEKVQIKCPAKPITHAFLQFIEISKSTDL